MEMIRSPGLRLGALVGGVLVAAVLQVLLMTLGAAIGLTAFTAGEQQQAEIQLGYAGWLVLSLVLSVFFGALVAAAGARSPLRGDGVLHGVVIWAAIGLLGFFLVSRNLDAALGGALRLAGRSVEATAPTPEAARVVREQGQAAAQEVQTQVGAAVDQVTQAVTEVGTGMQAAQATDEARQGIAVGLWGFLGVELVLLLAALAGGALGGRSRYSSRTLAGSTFDARLAGNAQASAAAMTRTSETPA